MKTIYLILILVIGTVPKEKENRQLNNISLNTSNYLLSKGTTSKIGQMQRQLTTTHSPEPNQNRTEAKLTSDGKIEVTYDYSNGNSVTTNENSTYCNIGVVLSNTSLSCSRIFDQTAGKQFNRNKNAAFMLKHYRDDFECKNSYSIRNFKGKAAIYVYFFVLEDADLNYLESNWNSLTNSFEPGQLRFLSKNGNHQSLIENETSFSNTFIYGFSFTDSIGIMNEQLATRRLLQTESISDMLTMIDFFIKDAVLTFKTNETTLMYYYGTKCIKVENSKLKIDDRLNKEGTSCTEGYTDCFEGDQICPTEGKLKGRFPISQERVQEGNNSDPQETKLGFYHGDIGTQMSFVKMSKQNQETTILRMSCEGTELKHSQERIYSSTSETPRKDVEIWIDSSSRNKYIKVEGDQNLTLTAKQYYSTATICREDSNHQYSSTQIYQGNTIVTFAPSFNILDDPPIQTKEECFPEIKACQTDQTDPNFFFVALDKVTDDLSVRLTSKIGNKLFPFKKFKEGYFATFQNFLYLDLTDYKLEKNILKVNNSLDWEIGGFVEFDSFKLKTNEITYVFQNIQASFPLFFYIPKENIGTVSVEEDMITTTNGPFNHSIANFSQTNTDEIEFKISRNGTEISLSIKNNSQIQYPIGTTAQPGNRPKITVEVFEQVTTSYNLLESLATIECERREVEGLISTIGSQSSLNFQLNSSSGFHRFCKIDSLIEDLFLSEIADNLEIFVENNNAEFYIPVEIRVFFTTSYYPKSCTIVIDQCTTNTCTITPKTVSQTIPKGIEAKYFLVTFTDDIEGVKTITARCQEDRDINKTKEITVQIPSCPPSECKFFDSEGNLYRDCPEAKKYHFNFKCYEECPLFASKHYSTNMCTDKCRTLTEGNKCVEACSEGTKLSGTDCVSECTGTRPFEDNNICVPNCGNKYSSGNSCVSECPIYYKHDLKCVSSCAPPLLIYLHQGKRYCLLECPSDRFQNLQNYCVPKPDCTRNQVMVDYNCYDCKMFIFDNKCMYKCPDGYTPIEGICTKCSQIVLNHTCSKNSTTKCQSDCVSECPTGTEAFFQGEYSMCVSCFKLDKIVEDGKCVPECSQAKVPNSSKECVYCEKAYLNGKCVEECPNNQIPDRNTKKCIGCGSEWSFKDGTCTKICNFFKFTYKGVKICVKCSENTFFYNGGCTSSCPAGTETVLEDSTCRDTPVNCKLDSNKCLNNSICFQTSSEYASCLCSTNKAGLVCQSNSLTSLETFLKAKLKSNPTLNELRQAKQVSIQNSKFKEETLSSIYRLLSESLPFMSLFELLDILFLSDTSQRAADYFTFVFKKTHFSRRILKESNIFFRGSAFTYAAGENISLVADIDQCLLKIETDLNLNRSELDKEILKIPVEISKHLDLPGFEISANPFIIASIMHLNKPVDTSICSASDVTIKYPVIISDEETKEKVIKVNQKGVNPFDSGDSYFSDICSLRQNNKDITLSRRKSTSLVDAQKLCTSSDVIKCVVEEIDQFYRPICLCKVSSKSFGEILEEYLRFFSESNIRIAGCIELFFTSVSLHSAGFWTSLSIILIFYTLAILSHRLTKHALNTKKLSKYLLFSAVHLDKSAEELIETELTIEATEIESSQRFKKGISCTHVDIDCFSFEEKLKYDKRSLFYYLRQAIMKFHPYLEAATSYNLYVPLHLRLFIIMTTLNLEMSLNALFFTDTVVNQRADEANPVKL